MFRFAFQRLLTLGLDPRMGNRPRSTTANNETLDVSECAATLCSLAEQSLQLMKEAGKKVRTFTTKKHSADLITETDTEIEKLLVKGLQKKYPDHVYIGEEGTRGTSSGQKLTEKPTWIIDPIDGTTNFVHGLPYTCISVGLWLNKMPELAICYNPIMDWRFTARRNHGAYLNGNPIRTSGQTQLGHAIIMHELQPSNFEPKLLDIQMANAIKFLHKAHALRTVGSAAMNLCLLAMGAGDGYYEFCPRCWDVAAGVLMVREAGGVVIDPAGGEFDVMARRVLAAATPDLACQMVELLGDMQIYHRRDDEKPDEKRER